MLKGVKNILQLGVIFGSTLTGLLTNFYINRNYIVISKLVDIDLTEIYRRVNEKM
jgi:hypothetical protein